MKRVLIITYDFAPYQGTGAIRITHFAKHLPEFDWQPLVLTTNRYGALLTDAAGYIYRASDLINSLFSPLRRYRLRCIPQAQHLQVATIPNDSWLGRLRDRIMVPDTKIGWFLPAIKLGRDLIRQYQPELIFSTSPPETAHLIARRLSRSSGIPWIADMRDGWLFEPPNPTLRQSSLRRSLEAKLEKQMINQASTVIAVTSPIIDDLGIRYPYATHKMSVITNGYDKAEFMNLSRQRQPDGQFLLTYTGALSASGQGRSAIAFFNALAILLQEDPDTALHVRIIGNISQKEKTLAHSLGLSKIVDFISPVPRQEALKYQLDADVLLLITVPGHRSEATLKLFEYIGAGVPILALAENNAAAEIVQQYHLGLTVPPDDPQAIAQALTTLISRKGDGYDQTGLAAAQNIFDRRHLTAQLAELFEHILV